MDGQTNKPFTTRTQLSTHLENQIVSGRLEEGAKLPSERRLAEQFNMSRPAVREALRSLVERNLIEVVNGRGAYVRRTRVSDAARSLELLFKRQRATPRDLVEARKMLECEAASLAAARAEQKDLRAMKWALERLERTSDLLEQARYDMIFHASIARAAHNPVMETMFGSITNLTLELMLRSLGDPAVSRVGLPYHWDIYRAISARDMEQARVAMAGHLSVAEKLYGEDYDAGLGTLAQRELGRLLELDATLEDLDANLEDLLGAAMSVGGRDEPEEKGFERADRSDEKQA